MTEGKLTLDALKPRDYVFQVESPDGETVTFTFRAPSQAAFWGIDTGNPAPDRDDFVNQQMPFNKDFQGNVIPVRDKEGYQKAFEVFVRDMMFRKILAVWVDADTLLKGKTEAERMCELGELASWVISALWKITQMLMATRRDVINAISFRGN